MGELNDIPWEHIIVDEFQDSNPNQIEIIKSLTNGRNYKSLAAVGDGNQAIYGFRNATREIFDSIEKSFPKIENIPLVDNFRSDNRINQFANSMVDSMNTSAIKIVSHGTDGFPPYFKMLKKGGEGEAEEVRLFTAQIQKLIEVDKVSPGDIAILARTRNELINFQSELDKFGIPNILKVKKIIAEEPYADSIISLAHFIHNNDDEEDLAFYVKYMEENFDIETDRDLVGAYKETIIDGFNYCMCEAQKIEYFFNLIEPLRKDYIGDAFAKKLEEFKTIKDILEFCIHYRLYGIRDQISSTRDDIEAVNVRLVP